MNKQIEKKPSKLKQKFLTLALLTSMTLLPLKLDAQSVHRSSNELYVYSKLRNVLISQNPGWVKKMNNVCNVQFADYTNKDFEEVPVLFVAYNDGRAGFLILPNKGENEYKYYEFDEKFKPSESGKCFIFEGVEENILYFRVVEEDGKTKNYGIPYGMF